MTLGGWNAVEEPREVRILRNPECEPLVQRRPSTRFVSGELPIPASRFVLSISEANQTEPAGTSRGHVPRTINRAGEQRRQPHPQG